VSEIFVYLDLQNESHLVGRLWPLVRQGRESATFEYDRPWLANPLRFSLEPALYLGAGPQHTAADQVIFGALGDSDRIDGAEHSCAMLSVDAPRKKGDRLAP
jgi:serine/threonine-protein kinase HipA